MGTINSTTPVLEHPLQFGRVLVWLIPGDEPINERLMLETEYEFTLEVQPGVFRKKQHSWSGFLLDFPWLTNQEKLDLKALAAKVHNQAAANDEWRGIT